MNFTKNNLLKYSFIAIMSFVFIQCGDDDEQGCTASSWYEDSDSDGLGNPDVFLDACEQPEGYVADNTDTDDTIAFCEVLTWYEDADGDGLGNVNVSQDACEQPEGYVADSTDENDEPSAYYVGIDYGSDFADFLSTADSFNEGTISPVGNGFEQLAWANYTQGIDQIFSRTTSGITSYEKDENGDLVEGLLISPNLLLYAQDVVDESTMVGVGSPWYAEGSKELYIIDTDAMSITKTVETTLGDFYNSDTDFGISMPTSAKVVGDNLFISYLLFDGTGDASNQDVANIAVYSYPDLEFKKIISDDRASTVGRYFSEFGMATDENDNLYTISTSSLASGYEPVPSTLKSSVLKINSGETVFDTDYYLDFETLSGGYKLNDIFYVANGKAVVGFSTDDSTAWGTYGYSASPVLGYGILDLENAAFTDLSGDMELSAGGFNGAVLVEGTTAYVGVHNTTYSGIYVIDVEGGTVSEGADVDGNSIKGILSLK